MLHVLGTFITFCEAPMIDSHAATYNTKVYLHPENTASSAGPCLTWPLTIIHEEQQ